MKDDLQRPPDDVESGLEAEKIVGTFKSPLRPNMNIISGSLLTAILAVVTVQVYEKVFIEPANEQLVDKLSDHARQILRDFLMRIPEDLQEIAAEYEPVKIELKSIAGVGVKLTLDADGCFSEAFPEDVSAGIYSSVLGAWITRSDRERSVQRYALIIPDVRSEKKLRLRNDEAAECFGTETPQYGMYLVFDQREDGRWAIHATSYVALHQMSEQLNVAFIPFAEPLVVEQPEVGKIENLLNTLACVAGDASR